MSAAKTTAKKRGPMAHWLIKSEPEVYSFQQLVKDKKTVWSGVRNYAARLHLRAMKKGDLAFFYHSNTGKAVVGVAKVVREHYQDPTTKDDWSAVDFAPVKAFTTPVTLDAVREHPTLKDMVLLKQGRLSVSPVTKTEWDAVLAAGKTAL
jgi:predicted RNA-binding protein with PUA-like domain